MILPKYKPVDISGYDGQYGVTKMVKYIVLRVKSL